MSAPLVGVEVPSSLSGRHSDFYGSINPHVEHTPLVTAKTPMLPEISDWISRVIFGSRALPATARSHSPFAPSEALQLAMRSAPLATFDILRRLLFRFSILNLAWHSASGIRSSTYGGATELVIILILPE